MSFRAPDLSSLGGLALVAKAEKSCGIIRSISACVDDWRKPGLICHTIKDMVGQRVMQIACGYEEAPQASPMRIRLVFPSNADPHANQAPQTPQLSTTPPLLMLLFVAATVPSCRIETVIGHHLNYITARLHG